jgi:acyl-ACP thioesterase
VTARRYSAHRPIRLSDTDATGRLRLDAVARYLQDVAADDVLDAGWSPDEHIWVVRRTVLDVERPFLEDTAVDLTTWCAGVAAAAAARRTTLEGDRGGRIEAEMIWIHLGRDLQPERLGERFLDVYGESAAGRKASTRLVLSGPAAPVPGTGWHVRSTDVDTLGHMNNAAYWAAVEERWGERLADPARVVLEYRKPIDRFEAVVLAQAEGRLWLTVAGEVRAAAGLSSPGGADDPVLRRFEHVGIQPGDR